MKKLILIAMLYTAGIQAQSNDMFSGIDIFKDGWKPTTKYVDFETDGPMVSSAQVINAISKEKYRLQRVKDSYHKALINTYKALEERNLTVLILDKSVAKGVNKEPKKEITTAVASNNN